MSGPSLQFLTQHDHPAGSAFTYFAPLAIRSQSTPLIVPLPHAPRYGEHTREVLLAAGINPEPLLTRGVASEGWSAAYLPGHPIRAASPTKSLPTEAPEATGGQPLTSRHAKVEVKHGEADMMAMANGAMAVGESKERHEGEGNEACPVCLEAITTRRVQLACSHSLCGRCATRCGETGHRHCPVCRQPHLLHPSRLAERSTAWRQRYAAWRGGSSSGAHGELSTIRTPNTREALEEGFMQPGGAVMGEDGHSLRCGILMHMAAACSSERAIRSAAEMPKVILAPRQAPKLLW